MKTRTISWSNRAFRIDGEMTSEDGISTPIKSALTTRGVKIKTDWESGYPHSAEIGREDWEAICDAVTDWRFEVKAEMDKASRAPVTVCSNCGGPMNGRTVCMDCN